MTDLPAPAKRRISIVFDAVSDTEYNAIANALWAVVAAANAPGSVYPDRQADLTALNDTWAQYSETEWQYDPDEPHPGPTTKAER
ncbi:hypothetical protein Q9R29_08565 [Rothia sp. ARF10]|nr:hypothetical protein [Rothia sp. ARF10]